MQIEELKLENLAKTLSYGLDSASSVISDMVEKNIKLEACDVVVLSHSEGGSFVHEAVDVNSFIVEQKFNSPFRGKSSIVFSDEVIDCSVKTLSPEDDDDKSPARVVGVISEIGNLMINGIVSSIVDILGMDLIFQVPNFYHGNGWRITSIEEGGGAGENENVVIFSKVRMGCGEHLVTTQLYIVLSKLGFDTLMERIPCSQTRQAV